MVLVKVKKENRLILTVGSPDILSGPSTVYLELKTY